MKTAVTSIQALLAVACLFAGMGCQPANDNATASSELLANKPSKPLGKTPTAGGAAPVFANQIDPAPIRLRVVRLDVHRLVVPAGAISRSDEFWKHVDEQRIDVGTYDLLRKNGWRLGVAPAEEWGYFRDIISAHPASSKRSMSAPTAGGAGAMEMAMKEKVAYQNIFYFVDAGAVRGQGFEECDNLLSVTVQEVPRKPGEARVTVCPLVRGLRKRFEITKLGEEREIRYVHPEHLYDLNLQVDVPMGHFLVIAPSPEARWASSLGTTFLVEDGAAERLENVILMVPHVEERQEVKTAAPPPAP